MMHASTKRTLLKVLIVALSAFVAYSTYRCYKHHCELNTAIRQLGGAEDSEDDAVAQPRNNRTMWMIAGIFGALMLVAVIFIFVETRRAKAEQAEAIAQGNRRALQQQRTRKLRRAVADRNIQAEAGISGDKLLLQRTAAKKATEARQERIADLERMMLSNQKFNPMNYDQRLLGQAMRRANLKKYEAKGIAEQASRAKNRLITQAQKQLQQKTSAYEAALTASKITASPQTQTTRKLRQQMQNATKKLQELKASA